LVLGGQVEFIQMLTMVQQVEQQHLDHYLLQQVVVEDKVLLRVLPHREEAQALQTVEEVVTPLKAVEAVLEMQALHHLILLP
jgi:hypothetical protein